MMPTLTWQPRTLSRYIIQLFAAYDHHHPSCICCHAVDIGLAAKNIVKVHDTALHCMINTIPAALAVFTMPLKSSIACINIVNNDLIMNMQISISTYIVLNVKFVPEITLLEFSNRL